MWLVIEAYWWSAVIDILLKLSTAIKQLSLAVGAIAFAMLNYSTRKKTFLSRTALKATKNALLIRDC